MENSGLDFLKHIDKMMQQPERKEHELAPGQVYLVTFDGWTDYGSYIYLLGIFDNYEALEKAIANLPEELRNPQPVEDEDDSTYNAEEDDEDCEIEPRIKITVCSINEALKVEKDELRGHYDSPVCLGV